MKLSIIIPVFNEENNIDPMYQRLTATSSRITDQYEMIFVDDGSKDQTLHKIQTLAQQDTHVHYISFTRNFGHQMALHAGCETAKGEAIVFIDGDLQDPPELIESLYKKWEEGFKIVYAQRESRKGESVIKKSTAALFYRLFAKMIRFEIPLDTGDFRLIDRKVLELLLKMPEANKFIRGQIAWSGYSQTRVRYERQERASGETGYSMTKMLHFALDGITSFSNYPLRFVSTLGMVISLFSFIVIVYALFSKFFMGETISGWTSLIISSMLVGGIQLISIGVIGQYISRINLDVKHRPLYVIEEQK